MDNRKRRHPELQHSSRRAGQVLTVWFVWIEVKVVAMTMAQKKKLARSAASVAMTTASPYVLSEWLKQQVGGGGTKRKKQKEMPEFL